jgi:quercetin dioxygenase-like cupin family protein
MTKHAHCFLRREGRTRRLPAVSVLALFILWAASWTPAGAQQPPGPRVEISASIEIVDSPRQYDVAQMLVEFPPGAANLSHRVNGRAIFTVISGRITQITDDGEATVFEAGDTFTETRDDVHFDVEVNNWEEPARLLGTFLLDLGAPPLIFNPNARPPGAPGPVVIAAARTSVNRIPAEFTLTHGIIATEAGGVVPAHTHDGWQLVTTFEGSPVVRLGGVEQTGATFVDKPGVVHEGGNPGPGRARLMFAALNPVGSPPARPLPGAGSQAGIQPPSTGNGGLAEGR